MYYLNNSWNKIVDYYLVNEFKGYINLVNLLKIILGIWDIFF